jgi:hypothetical protein
MRSINSSSIEHPKGIKYTIPTRTTAVLKIAKAREIILISYSLKVNGSVLWPTKLTIPIYVENQDWIASYREEKILKRRNINKKRTILI